ncbi:MAG: sensor histidine kinase [Chitinophagaceae bacterium]|nr:sensor histidine kinase [Anaerolineae bacterium]
MDREQDPRAELVDTVTAEMTTIKRKLSEIKAQVDQTQIMVDREQQRNSDIATDLQNVQANLDTVPREDIRDKYNEALDARFRLATMRGQLEKFQSHYSQLESQQTLLSQVLNKVQGGLVIPESADDIQEVGGPLSLNIVRIVQAQEEERQRLARQMHDGPAQSLTNFILQAEICQRLFDRNPDRAGEELSNLKTAASVTFQKVRDFIFDLRPMMLDDLGVVPTVRRYVDSFREKNDIATELEFSGEERRLESHREVMVFRTIQELMGHARDYATATQLKVKLDMSGKAVRIALQDNGRSFDAEAIFSGEESHLDGRGQGLLTMKEKFELVGGTMSVLSTESDGTLVRVELPSGD